MGLGERPLGRSHPPRCRLRQTGHRAQSALGGPFRVTRCYRITARSRGFYRCNANHHSLAIADGEATTLNHVAFEVNSIDDMMRGAGRVMNDGRARVMWGPGRHSAGDNTFYYFFDPEGNVSEYTAEVEMILDDDAWTPKEHAPIDMWNTAGRPGGGPANVSPNAPATAGRPAEAGDLPPTRIRAEDPGLWVAPPV